MDARRETPPYKGKVLVAEDERDLAALWEFTLRAAGYETVVAYNGTEALERVEAEFPDLILLDLRMPRMSGLQVVERLQTNPRTHSIPIIVVTAFSGGLGPALQLGVNDFIFKPVEPDELLASVERLLQAARFSHSAYQVRTALPGRRQVEEHLTELLFDKGWTVLLVELESGTTVERAARIMAREVRARLAGRWDEREFVLVVAWDQVERVRSRLGNFGLPLAVGIARGEAAGSFAEVEEIIAEARRRMVRAKGADDERNVAADQREEG